MKSNNEKCGDEFPNQFPQCMSIQRSIICKKSTDFSSFFQEKSFSFLKKFNFLLEIS